MEKTSRSVLCRLATVAAIAIAACDSQEPKSGESPSTVCTVELSARSEPELRKAVDNALRSTTPCDPAGLRTADARTTSIEVTRFDQAGDTFRAELRVLSNAE
ncbi:MAG: hypothetical protein ACJ783_22320 [Myxococcales bacterium]